MREKCSILRKITKKFKEMIFILRLQVLRSNGAHHEQLDVVDQSSKSYYELFFLVGEFYLKTTTTTIILVEIIFYYYFIQNYHYNMAFSILILHLDTSPHQNSLSYILHLDTSGHFVSVD